MRYFRIVRCRTVRGQLSVCGRAAVTGGCVGWTDGGRAGQRPESMFRPMREYVRSKGSSYDGQ